MLDLIIKASVWSLVGLAAIFVYLNLVILRQIYIWREWVQRKQAEFEKMEVEIDDLRKTAFAQRCRIEDLEAQINGGGMAR